MSPSLRAPLLIVLVVAACGRLGYDPLGRANGDAGITDPGTGDGGITDPGTGDAGTTDGGTLPVTCADPICDLSPQCGCESGQKCDVDGLGSRSCSTAGTALHAESCLSSADCTAGTSCTQMSDWPAGVNACFQFCNIDSDCSALGRGAFCRLSASSGGQLLFSLCTLPCDMLAQTGCPTETQCSIYNFGTIAGTNCTAPGTLKLGDTCAAHFDCGPSMVCVNSTCQQACIAGDASPCQGATSCRGLGLISQDIEYGACL
jgi:hypothetical protein